MSDSTIGHLVSAEFLAKLKSLYPLRPPHPDTPERKVWMDAGQQTLIEFLEAAHNDVIHQPLLSE